MACKLCIFARNEQPIDTIRLSFSGSAHLSALTSIGRDAMSLTELVALLSRATDVAGRTGSGRQIPGAKLLSPRCGSCRSRTLNARIAGPDAAAGTRGCAPSAAGYSVASSAPLIWTMREPAEEDWLLVGDSHAAQLNLFFDVVGRANNFKVMAITGSSCVTIPGFDVQRIPEDSRRACSQQIERALPLIEKASMIAIAGMWQYHASSEEFWTAFEAFLSSLAARQKPVLVFAQIPMLDGDPLRARRFEYLGVPRLPSIETGWASANCRMQQLVARFPSARFFDLSANPVFSHAPAYEGSTIYFDGSHLNELGARLYGEAAKGLLVPGAIRTPESDACGAELGR